MTFIHFTLLAAGSLPALVLGAPLPSDLSTRIGTIATEDSSFTHSAIEKRGTDAYKMYAGNGQTSWPEVSQWVSSFDDMFNANKAIINGGCTQFGVTGNSDQETSDISTGIKQVSGETGIDARFILAVLLQESNGCVRAPTTNYGVRNPGLMQDHNGAATCNDGGTIQNPCPANTIVQMIRDGVAGTASGDGLKQTLNQAPGTGATKYYGGARIYNSGSIAASGDLGAGIATHCYASDVANRLTGWVFAKKQCSLDGASVDASPSSPAPASSPSAAPAPVATLTPAPAPASNAQPAAPPPATAAPNTSTKAVSTNMAPGATTQCSQYYTIQRGDICNDVAQKFGTTFSVLRSLNSQLDTSCSNLWRGYDYCVKGL